MSETEIKLPNSLDVEKERAFQSITDALYDEVFGAEIDPKKWAGRPSFDWRKFEPKYEGQNWGDCVSFSRLNVSESKAKRLGILDDEGQELNFADLYLAVKSGTTMDGNSMGVVAQYARKSGVVLQRHCPYVNRWEDRAAQVAKVSDAIKRYMLGDFSRVPASTPSIKSALEDGPLQLGIPLDNPYNTEDVIPMPQNTLAWHAVTLQFMDEQDRFHIFDHYDKKNKILAADYTIPFIYSFRDLPEDWRTRTTDVQKMIARLTDRFILRAEARGELYRVYADKLVKVAVFISDLDLRREVNEALRLNKRFIGISEANFAKLADALPIN